MPLKGKDSGRVVVLHRAAVDPFNWGEEQGVNFPQVEG